MVMEPLKTYHVHSPAGELKFAVRCAEPDYKRFDRRLLHHLPSLIQRITYQVSIYLWPPSVAMRINLNKTVLWWD